MYSAAARGRTLGEPCLANGYTPLSQDGSHHEHIGSSEGVRKSKNTRHAECYAWIDVVRFTKLC